MKRGRKKAQDQGSDLTMVSGEENDPQVCENQATEIDINDADRDEIRNESAELSLFLPPKDLFRVDEVARHLDISERCVRLWLDHGHLEGVKIVGSIRITRESIIRCVEKYIPNRVRIS